MNQVSISGLHKSFGAVPVLRGLDLEVPAGALAAVLGPSGCGKTTLLRVIAGFERADAGLVRVGERLVAHGPVSQPPERRRVGIVPQEGALFPHLSVAANVAFGLPRGRWTAFRRGGATQRARVAELLELVGLAELAGRMPAELSGGQQQRVALARALAPRPDVVLLDEPFSALDAGLRASVRDDVRAALRAAGATGILVTHDQEEALSIADLVAVLRDGVVVQAGSPQEVYRAPADLGVARFVGEAVELPATLVDGAALVETPLGRLPVGGGGSPAAADAGAPASASAAAGVAMLRPEQLLLTGAEEADRKATVVSSVFHGHDASVQLEVVTDSGPLRLLARTQGPPPPAGPVGLRVDGPVCFYPQP